MGKAPAFQFYVRDWLSDPQLRAASTSTKGVWIDLLCFMWEAPERGKLTGLTKEHIAKMTGATLDEVDIFLTEIKSLNFGCVTEHDKKITLENRRMVREEKARKDNADRQARFRQKKKSLNNTPSNEKVTSLSSSSTSVTPPNPHFLEFWKAYPKRVGKGAAEKAWAKIKKPKTTLQEILKALEHQKKSEQWTKQNGQFIPNPSTYLNQRRWEDELEDTLPEDELIFCANCHVSVRPWEIEGGKCPACGKELK